jgi:hypothetical protein
MDEELDRLAESAGLRGLLTHYAAGPDREVWHGRVMELAGVTAKELVKLHGELIAYGWVEQNTGVVPGGYRVTPVGVRALRQVDRRDDDRATAA